MTEPTCPSYSTEIRLTEIAGRPAHSVNARRVDLAPQDAGNLGGPPIAVIANRWDAAGVEAVCDGPQTCGTGRL